MLHLIWYGNYFLIRMPCNCHSSGTLCPEQTDLLSPSRCLKINKYYCLLISTSIGHISIQHTTSRRKPKWQSGKVAIRMATSAWAYNIYSSELCPCGRGDVNEFVICFQIDTRLIGSFKQSIYCNEDWWLVKVVFSFAKWPSHTDCDGS